MLNIIPTMGQSLVNYGATNLSEAASAKNTTIILGVEDEALFGSRFKIRLTSKKSGKKIDLNINFKTYHELTQRERK